MTVLVVGLLSLTLKLAIVVPDCPSVIGVALVILTTGGKSLIIVKSL